MNKSKFFYTIIIFFALDSFAIGQTTYSDTTKANTYIDQAISYINKDYDSCFYYINNALFIYQNVDYSEMISYCYKLASVCEYGFGNTISALKYNELSLEYLSKVNYSLPLDYISTTSDNGVFNSDIGNNFLALNKYMECLNHESFSMLDTSNQVSILTNVAHEFLLLGDAFSALSAYEKALILVKDSTSAEYLNIQISMSSALHKSNRSDQAWLLLNSVKRKLNQKSIGSKGQQELTAFLFQISSECHFAEGDINKAIFFMKDAAKLYSKLNRHQFIAAQLDLVEFYLFEGVLDTASLLINHSIKYYLSNQKESLNYFLAKASILKGKIELQSNNIKKAYIALNNATTYNGFADSDSIYHIINYRLGIEIEDLRLKLRRFRHPDGEDQNYPEVSFEPILTLITLSNHRYISERAKYDNLNSKISIFNTAILDLCTSNGLVKKPRYLNAFYWSDLSKGGVLSEQIARNRLLRQYENDSLYRYYIELTSDIHALKKQIINQKLNDRDAKNVSKSEIQLLDKTTELSDLEKITDFNHQAVSFNDFIEKHLRKQSLVLQVYSTDSNYIFLYQGENDFEDVMICSKPDLDKLLTEYIEMQRNDSYNVLDILTTSHKLFKTIFPSEISFSEFQHLTIIPAGNLNQLSFESLLISAPDSSTTLKSADFLFTSIPISYSLGLHLSKEFRGDSQRPKVAGFAPAFNSHLNANKRDCSTEIYGQLPCNEDEIESISSDIIGSKYFNLEASANNLTSSLISHQIIHLATHACIDTSNYYNSSIILQDGPMYISDMYDMDWHNKTVILSACNTAHGKVISGEGVFNFSRTLIELGCKEVVVSLWPIDDCQTASFMGHFYDHFSETNNTAISLQRARTSFLSEANKLHSLPMFWAPLILISNDIDVAQHEVNHDWTIPIMLLVLMAGSGFFFFYRNRKAA